MLPTTEVRLPIGYEAPLVNLAGSPALDESEIAWLAAIGWVLLVYGSAWGYCKAVCGWNGVSSCSQTWYGQVKAVCK